MSARLRKKDMYRCVSVWNNKNLKKLMTNCLIHYLPTGLLYADAKTLFSPSFSVAPVTSAFPPARRVALLALCSLHFIFEAVLGENWREKKAKKSAATLFIYLFIYSSYSSSSSSGGSVHLSSGGPAPRPYSPSANLPTVPALPGRRGWGVQCGIDRGDNQCNSSYGGGGAASCLPRCRLEERRRLNSCILACKKIKK